MTFTKPFPQTPKTATAVATAAIANIATDAPTDTVLLLTAGDAGAEVYRLTAIPRATVAASSLCLWVSNDGGTTKRLIDSALMAAYTLAVSTAVVVTSFATYTAAAPLRLAAGDKLYVGTQVTLAGGIVFRAEYMDL